MSSGFEYCVNQTLGGWCPTEKLFHLNRRRRWYRTRIINETKVTDEKKVIIIIRTFFLHRLCLQGNLISFNTPNETTALLVAVNETEVGFRSPLDLETCLCFINYLLFLLEKGISRWSEKWRMGIRTNV